MIEEISPSEFIEKRLSGELWQVLDVREPWEIDIASIDGAIRIPMTTVPERIKELDPLEPTAVLCHSGVRSRRIAEYLVSCGFARVANITGGIDLWSRTADPSIARY